MDGNSQAQASLDSVAAEIATAPTQLTTVRGWLLSFTLHVLTGFLAVAGHYGVMWVLLSFGTPAVPASAGGFMVGAAIRFFLSHFHIFSPEDGMPATLPRFIVSLGIQLAANMFILDVLLGFWSSVWLAQATTTVVMTFANYLMYRLWVFR